MRRLLQLGIDLGLVVLATASSFALRDNLDISLDRFWVFLPYIIATVLAAANIFVAIGLDTTVWRFSTPLDHLRVIAACLATTLVATAFTFAYNRLEGVSRSLPILQFLVSVFFLIGARTAYKISHDIIRRRGVFPAILSPVMGAPQLNILLVGVSKLTTVYLQAIDEFGVGRIKVAGIISQSSRYEGRLLANHRILGKPGDIEKILDGLDIHGVTIDQIVVACSLESMPQDERDTLIRVESNRAIPLRFLAEDLGLHRERRTRIADVNLMKERVREADELTFQIPSSELDAISGRFYWRLKRAVDCAGACVLVIAMFPVMAAAAILLAASGGSPVIFWQQRPGLGGRPFRVYKLRTMKAAQASDGRRLTDAERVSRLGAFMRRLRLDELPQLYNILRGDMSFIGPRPLLPCDQDDAHRTRLLVRPGLTGWAQVVGGRDISSTDKAALDVWYVRNASLMLDMQIWARTFIMLLFGERISRKLIEKAWLDLQKGGISRAEHDVPLTSLTH